MKSQLSCCPLIWMFWSRTSINKLNNIHKKCLRLVPNHHDSNFNELLELSHKLSIHKSCINYLMIEVYKYLHGLSPELMTDIFTLQEILTTFTVFVYFALKIHYQCVLDWMQIAFCTSQLWQKVLIAKKKFFININFQSKNSYGIVTIATINLNDCNIFFVNFSRFLLFGKLL